MEQQLPSHYQSKFVNNIPIALTFDDVLLVPQYSEVETRTSCLVQSRFSKNVPLKIPIVSSPMDTVTEAKLAKEMARCGGLGIIHRFMSIEEQAQQIYQVKRAQSRVILEPVVVSKDTTFAQMREIVAKNTFQTFLVVNTSIDEKLGSPQKLPSRKKSVNPEVFNKQLVGIITKRDLKNFRFEDETVEKYMTKRENLLVVEVNATCNSDFDESQIGNNKILLEKMYEKRIEKLPVVTKNNCIVGLVTRKDMEREYNIPLANKDKNGQLLVGAAVGANKDYIERAKKLIDAGCNALVVDVANGHSTIAIKAVQMLKEQFEDIDVVAGSIASGQGAEQLIKAGADGIRCGIGNGSICITRIVAGSGVPQLSALLDVAPICKQYDVPLISDGGNKCSGNMAKALAAGADCIMVGRLVAGTDESPSSIIFRDGKIMKVYRGMAGYGANFAKATRIGDSVPETDKFTPEGVEGYTPYSGPLNGVLSGFVQGIKSGMSYSGAFNIKEFQQKAQFIRITQSGYKESNVHSVNKI